MDKLLLIAWCIVGGLTLWRYFTGRKTISQEIQEAFDKPIDMLIWIAVVVGWFLVFGCTSGTTLLTGVIMGHWFWASDERKEDND